MQTMEKAFRYVDEHLDDMINELGTLCRYRSVAGDEEGLECTRKEIFNKLENIGLNPQFHYVEGGNALISAEKTGTEEDTILFYNHYDVVQEGKKDNWENKEPFHMVVQNGNMIARGISDNKGPLMSRIHAVEAIMAVNGGQLPAGVKFLLEGDEESASPSMAKFSELYPDKFRKLIDADLCLWENGRKDESGRPWARFGVRGSCSFELRVTTANTDVHSRMGATVPSAAWRLVWALAALKSPDEVVHIPGYYDSIIPPTDGDYEVLRNFPYEEEEQKKKLGISQYLLGATGEELKRRVYMEPSFSICGIESGEVYNGVRGIVPHTAYAKINIYLVADQNPEEIGKHLRKYLDEQGFADIEVIPGESFTRSVRTPVEIDARQHIQWAAEKVYSEPLVIELTQLGAGPAMLLREVCPELPIVGIGPANTSANHHAPNENMKVNDYKEAVKHIIALLYSYKKH